jgi:adenylate kinase family enzyme
MCRRFALGVRMDQAQRIMIIGGSGSGKSTLARQIGAAMGLPVVHIDPMYWAPGWAQRPAEETRALSLAAAAGEAWVFEGNHVETMDARAERADLIVFLDLPRGLRLARVVWRSVRHYGRSRPDMPPDCPERLDLDFLRTFVWGYDTRSRPRALAVLARWQGKRTILHLRSAAQVRGFVTEMQAKGLGKALQRTALVDHSR